MGFHIYGLMVSAVILLPNIFFFLFKPTEMPENLPKEPIILTIIENIGRIFCFLLPLVFGRDIAEEPFNLATALMIVCVAVYYIGWIRYFAGKRRFSLAFAPLGFIPIPMAVFPVLYFLFLSVWIKSYIFGIAAILLTAGHLPISWNTYKKLK